MSCERRSQDTIWQYHKPRRTCMTHGEQSCHASASFLELFTEPCPVNTCRTVSCRHMTRCCVNKNIRPANKNICCVNAQQARKYTIARSQGTVLWTIGVYKSWVCSPMTWYVKNIHSQNQVLQANMGLCNNRSSKMYEGHFTWHWWAFTWHWWVFTWHAMYSQDMVLWTRAITWAFTGQNNAE